MPVYAGALARGKLAGSGRRELLAEWARVFDQGPGLILIRDAIDDARAIDDASAFFIAAMETTLYPCLLALRDELGTARSDAAIEACAKTYPLPSNLDREPPTDGKKPESQSQLMKRALVAEWSATEFESAIILHQQLKQP